MVILHELFPSLQGEGSLAGWPHVILRLAGCNLRCAYCDTIEAQEMIGEEVDETQLADRACAYGIPRVLITGGEPLLQDGVNKVISTLIARGYDVSIETNGSVSIQGVHPNARILMDVKTPGSGESASTLLSNLHHLKPTDEIKFVLTGREDYDWARSFLKANQQVIGARIVHFGAASESLAPRKLAEWIVADRLPVRLNLQLHKILWPGEKRR